MREVRAVRAVRVRLRFIGYRHDGFIVTGSAVVPSMFIFSLFTWTAL